MFDDDMEDEELFDLLEMDYVLNELGTSDDKTDEPQGHCITSVLGFIFVIVLLVLLFSCGS